uniref:Uncharacterized protein n=1 Tax=Cacopsylla melanoneura TaxID=428564 RepID=A0A8D8ZWC1_9HEMI
MSPIWSVSSPYSMNRMWSVSKKIQLQITGHLRSLFSVEALLNVIKICGLCRSVRLINYTPTTLFVTHKPFYLYSCSSFKTQTFDCLSVRSVFCRSTKQNRSKTFEF